MTRQKRVRNKIYRGSGITIVAGVAAAALFQFLTSHQFRETWHPVFWCEAIAIIAFGFAWLVKGETLFADPPAARPGRLAWRQAWQRVRPTG
jgi:hypothetical protein